MNPAYKIGDVVVFVNHSTFREGKAPEEVKGTIAEITHNPNTDKRLYRIEGFPHWVAEEEIITLYQPK